MISVYGSTRVAATWPQPLKYISTKFLKTCQQFCPDTMLLTFFIWKRAVFFFWALPDTTLRVKGEEWKCGKRSKDRITASFCVSMTVIHYLVLKVFLDIPAIYKHSYQLGSAITTTPQLRPVFPGPFGGRNSGVPL